MFLKFEKVIDNHFETPVLFYVCKFVDVRLDFFYSLFTVFLGTYLFLHLRHACRMHKITPIIVLIVKIMQQGNDS